MTSVPKFLLAFTISISSLLLFSSCNNNEEKKEISIRFVKIETVSPMYLGTELIFNGTIKEESITEVSFRVGGPLEKFNVSVGSFVKKGEVIARIDQRDYILQLETAKAQYTQAKGEYNRYLELYKKKKLPENTLEKMEARYLMAKIAYEQAENALSDTELKAQVSGYIFEKFTENFQTVNPEKPIVSIVDMSKQEVVIHVPASKLQKINDSCRASCTVQNAGVSDLPIQLIAVSSKAGLDRLYEVRFQMKLDTNTKVKPGMTAEVAISGNTDESKMISIPVSSVFHINGESYIWIFNSQKLQVEKCKVMLSQLGNNGRILIKAGVKFGDQIVTTGIHSLVDNQQVKPLPVPSKTNVGGLL